MVLETPKLVRSLIMVISTSVPNFIIFPCSLHRAAIDSHWRGRRRRIIIIKKTYRYNRGYSPLGLAPKYSCKQRYRGQALKGCSQSNERDEAKRPKRNFYRINVPTPDSIPRPLGFGTSALAKCATLVDTLFAWHRREVKV